MQLREQEFRTACSAYLAHHQATREQCNAADQDEDLGPALYSKGWTWEEQSRPYMKPVGYLYRSFHLAGVHASPSQGETSTSQAGQDDVEEEDFGAPADPQDEATASNSLSPETLTAGLYRVEQSVCYSSIWRVPVLYFTVSQGSSADASSSKQQGEILMSCFLRSGPSSATRRNSELSSFPCTSSISRRRQPRSRTRCISATRSRRPSRHRPSLSLSSPLRDGGPNRGVAAA